MLQGCSTVGNLAGGIFVNALGNVLGEKLQDAYEETQKEKEEANIHEN